MKGGSDRAMAALRELDRAIDIATGLMLSGAQAEGRHRDAIAAMKSLTGAEMEFAIVMADAYGGNEFEILGRLRKEDE